ncbi:MAG TPA: DUF3180 domain-containing protein [Mycobacteriales bacterium]|nr:DUF3180 domain-containing protein [Mycobacteriales bacterium]
MSPLASTRLRDLAGYALGVALVVWLALRQWYGDMPRLGWFVPLSLLLLALAELIAAGQLRARIRRRPGTRPVQPLVAARTLALAKASAVVGAIMVGVWSGLLLYVLPRLDYLAAADDDARTGAVGAAAAASLVAAALWLEYCCRTPTPPDSDDQITPNGSRTP